jgi:hypothetical protein
LENPKNPVIEPSPTSNPEVEAAHENERKAHHLALLRLHHELLVALLDLNEFRQVVGAAPKKDTIF